MLEIKRDGGVKLSKLQPQIVLAIFIAHEVYADHGYSLTVTSGEEIAPGRRDDSLHYEGQAVDFRITHIPEHLWQALRDSVADAVGENYDVVLKSNHLHLEYDPDDA